MFQNTIRILLLCCLPLISANVFATTVNSKLYTLSVTIVDSVTKQPLEAASISIAELHKNTIANALGVGTFDSLPKGYYMVQCAFLGYHPQQQKIWVDADKRLVIELCPESTHLHEVEINSHTDDLTRLNIQTRATIEAQWIERNRGNNIADMLKQIPGVTIISSGVAIAKPVIRGLHSNRLVTINDGVRQEGQQWGADHGTEIDPFSSNKIEVIKGASSVEYGAEAIGGVIRMSPREFKNTKGVNGELSLNAAANNKMGASSLLLEGAHGSKHKLSWRTQGTMRKAGDSRTPSYVLSNTGYNELNGNYAMHYQFKNLHAEFTQSYFSTSIAILRASHVGNTSDLLQVILSGNPAYAVPFTYNIQNPRQEVSHTVSAFKTYFIFKSGAKIQTQWSLQYNNRKEYDRPPRWATSQLNNPTPQYYLQLKTQLGELKFEHPKWKNFKGAWGASWMKQENVSEGLQPIIPNFIATTSGIFAIEKWQKNRWVFEGGLRYDWRAQTRYFLVNKLAISEDKNYGSATFSAACSYWLNQHVKFQLQQSSAWRAPSINELYSNGLHGGTATYEIGNGNLQSERSYNTEFGLTYTNKKWNAELNLYRNYINNFIYKLPVNTPIVTIRGAFPQFVFMQNNALLQGADFLAHHYINKQFTASINASYLHAQQTDDNTPLIYMPANRFGLQIQYQQPKIWKLHDVFIQPKYTYVAKQSRYPEGIDYISPPDGYSLIDINFGFEQHIGKQTLRWSFSMYNVLNTSYRDYLSRYRYFVLEPGRNMMIRLTIPFNIYTKKQII
jgi:iron complex outermembrane receptor protein